MSENSKTKTYLIYMEEVSKLKKAIAEAKHYISTNQGSLAEVWSLDIETNQDQELYSIGNNSHTDNYNVEVLA